MFVKNSQKDLLQKVKNKVLWVLMEIAVIETGGKQYKVAPGTSIKIEKLSDTQAVGDKVTFDKVLLIDGDATKIGAPYIDGAKVEATVEEIGRHDKVIVLKYRAKSRYQKKNGHRQLFVKVKIDSIA